MAQDILLGRMRYEVEVTGGPGAQVNIQNLNLRMTQMRRSVKENEVALGHFLTKSKLGWAALGVTAGSAIGQIVKGSSLLSSIGGAPGKLLGAVGTALDIGFPEEMAKWHTWLAETEAGIIGWGQALGDADDKVKFIGKSLGELAGKTFETTLKIGVQAPGGAADIGAGIAAGIMESAGVPPGASDLLGASLAGGGTVAAERAAGRYIAQKGIMMLGETAAKDALGVGLARAGLGIASNAALPILAADALMSVGAGRAGGYATSPDHYYPGDDPRGYGHGAADFDTTMAILGQAAAQQGMGADYGSLIEKTQQLTPQQRTVIVNNYFANTPPNPDDFIWQTRQRLMMQYGGGVSVPGGTLP